MSVHIYIYIYIHVLGGGIYLEQMIGIEDASCW